MSTRWRRPWPTVAAGRISPPARPCRYVTASAAAIDDAGRVLMIRHRTLRRWLLPGGHLEPEDHSLYGAALRELGRRPDCSGSLRPGRRSSTRSP
ncbi:NUDIX domain-containing protein [Nonomuraea thailandensis]